MAGSFKLDACSSCCATDPCDNVSGTQDLSGFDLQIVISGTGTALDGTYIVSKQTTCEMSGSYTPACAWGSYGQCGFAVKFVKTSATPATYAVYVYSKYTLPSGCNYNATTSQQWSKDYGTTPPDASAFDGEVIPFLTEAFGSQSCSAWMAGTLTLTAV